MLAEVNSHDFDCVRWLVGSEITRVYAETANRKGAARGITVPDFYDNAVVSLRFASGAIGTIDGTCSADYGYDARVELLGSEGLLLIGDVRGQPILELRNRDVGSIIPTHRAYPAGTLRVPGHEIAGVLVARGSAFAEEVLLPADLIAQGNVLPAPDARDLGALALVEPLACVLRGSWACAIEAGDLVLISGAGPIGLLHLHVARLRAPRAIVVSEPNPARRAQARAWGADQVVDPLTEDLADLIAQISNGEGADVVIVVAPAAQARAHAITLAARGGRINFFGGLPKDRSSIPIDANLIHYNELIVTYARLCGEVSCIAKRDGRLRGWAKDPISAGRTLGSILGRGYFGRVGGEVLCFEEIFHRPITLDELEALTHEAAFARPPLGDI